MRMTNVHRLGFTKLSAGEGNDDKFSLKLDCIFLCSRAIY
jgi:hypothetical protein